MIEADDHGKLRLLTINRPEKANSLTAEMLTQLLAEVGRADTDNCGALVLTGAGRVFSAGADLEEARAGLAVSPLWEQLSGAIAASNALTICALNGTLAGGAFGMALACDLRLAVPEARFFYPVMTLGFLPQPSDPLRLRALVGPSRAKMILMAGQKIEAHEALAWGLIDRIVEGEALIGTAEALSEAAIAASQEHRQAIKALCQC